METSELAKRIKEEAYLEGDFVLRSGKRSKYYLDKYLFESQPDILAELESLSDEEAEQLLASTQEIGSNAAGKD